MSINTTKENDAQVRQEQIALRAQQIWEREGRQPGHDLEYWLQAERELRSGKSQINDPPGGPQARLENSRSDNGPRKQGNRSDRKHL